MTDNSQTPSDSGEGRPRRNGFFRRPWLAAAVVVLAAAGYFLTRRGTSGNTGLTYAARRGPLEITVLEGGSLQALDSLEIKCEVRVGYQGTKILKIVEEGYLVTPEDVAKKKVLIELDSTEINKQLVEQEIQFQSATATLTDAEQSYEIQLNQNMSDTKAAEQKARFARLDFGKFVGDDLAKSILLQLAPEAPLQTSAEAASAAVMATNGPPVDFNQYASLEALGDGEAKQKARKFQDDLQVAQKELGQAKVTLEGTKRLFDKGFVTKTDLQRDEIAFENSQLKVQTADTARALFLKYEFIKTAEETLSKYTEAARELDRARKAAISKLAQADARLKSSHAQYDLQARQNKELKQQLEYCVIKATKPGLVVYGGNQQDMSWGEERIREGATVRERQAIITIPNLTQMAVNVKIHESYVKRVAKGQHARITVDAFPDKTLEGEVTRVGVLPDSQNRWMNPDMKVYLTMITINGSQDWVKPGMSAKVEIFVDHLPDVLQVPLQAVAPFEKKRYCHVVQGGRTERMEVEVGQFNDEFIEVKSGLKEGDQVLLRAPDAQGGAGSESQKPAPAAPPATPARKTALNPGVSPSPRG